MIEKTYLMEHPGLFQSGWIARVAVLQVAMQLCSTTVFTDWNAMLGTQTTKFMTRIVGMVAQGIHNVASNFGQLHGNHVTGY